MLDNVATLFGLRFVIAEAQSDPLTIPEPPRDERKRQFPPCELRDGILYAIEADRP